MTSPLSNQSYYKKRAEEHLKIGLLNLSYVLAVDKRLSNIGERRNMVNNGEKALAYFQQALLDARQAEDKQIEASALIRIGETLSQLGYNLRAIKYYEKAMPVYRNLPFNTEADACYLVGLAYFDTGQLKPALDYLTQAMEIVSSRGNDKLGVGFGIGLEESDLVEQNYKDTIFASEIKGAYTMVSRWSKGWRKLAWDLLFSHLFKRGSDEQKITYKIRPVEELPDIYGLPIFYQG